MTTFFLIALPLGGIIGTLYEAWLLRRGRGSWLALVSGVLTYSLLTISVIEGRAEDDRVRSLAGLGGTLSLIGYIMVTRNRHRSPKPGLNIDHNRM